MKEDSENEEEDDMKEGEGLRQDGETREEEGRKAAARKGPKMPTTMEQGEHARTHCPYRSWCRHCVQARARSSPHRAGEERKGVEEGVGPAKVPRVAMDYFFMSIADEKAPVKPLIVMADEESGSRYARAVGHKGARGWSGNELASSGHVCPAQGVGARRKSRRRTNRQV